MAALPMASRQASGEPGASVRMVSSADRLSNERCIAAGSPDGRVATKSATATLAMAMAAGHKVFEAERA